MKQPDRGRISYLLYLAGLATALCGLGALNSVLSDAGFAATMGILICLGYTTSITLRGLGYTARFVEIAVIGAAMVVYAQLIAGEGFSGAAVPLAAQSTPELRLAAMLLWLEVLRSFTLVSDDSVVFSAIPTIALISLSSTSNFNPEMMALFIIYLALAVFLLAHSRATQAADLKPTFRAALAVASLALAVGLVISVPIRFICTKGFGAVMPNFTRADERFLGSAYGETDVLQIAQGPIHLSDATVMTVRAHLSGSAHPVGAYWRGKVFDHYTGHGWQVSAPYRWETSWQVLPAASSAGALPKSGTAPPSGRRLLEQVIRVRAARSRTVYAAAEPVAVAAPYAQIQRNAFNCWRGVRVRPGATAYRAWSSPPTSDANSLRRAPMNYAPDVREYFLQTTTSLNRVGQLARRITKGIANPYDKACAIQSYIAEHCAYDLNAPPAPPLADAVDYFLSTSNAGYCDVFASAMVVMCREVGIPARLATGFNTGEFVENAKHFRVRDMDRHAWAELYFPGYGWVAFDPTALCRGREQGWLARVAQGIRRAVERLLGGSAAVPIAILLLGACMVFAFASEIRGIRLARRPHAPSRLHAAALAHYAAIRRTLRVHAPALTPVESALAADLGSAGASAAALEAARLFGSIRYSGASVTRDDVHRLKELHAELKATAKAASRASQPRP